MTIVGFLHTSPAHVAAFDALVAEALPDAGTRHVVDEDLLARARGLGPAAVTGAVRGRVDQLVAAGVDAICCTCSTIGGVAEALPSPVPLFRVDRPMAAAAVRLGRRVGIVVALESTREPTLALIREESARAGLAASLTVVLADGAWASFEADDPSGYARAVADVARRASAEVDVIVLAQASMTGAEPLLRDVGVPVLSSPRLAVEHLRQLVRRSCPAPGGGPAAPNCSEDGTPERSAG